MDRRRLLLVAAALVATLGVVLVLLYVRGADDRARSRFDTVQVLRATAPIEPGETLEAAASAGKVELQPVPRGQLLTGVQTTADALSGLVALTRIYPGEQIIADKFGGQAQAASPLQIPRGQLAISVNLTDPARVAGFVNPGSQIAVFVNGAGATGQPFTRMLLDRVTVLGVGSTTPVSTTTTDDAGQQTTEQLPRTLLTIAVDQRDAQKVLFASSTGEVAFALLTDSSSVRPGPGVTALNLFK
jgi:pilus assembly protein CpaB